MLNADNRTSRDANDVRPELARSKRGEPSNRHAHRRPELARINRNEPLSRRAYREIRQAIFFRELKDGQRLTEVELARALGLSRTPVHEAIARLAHEHLVETMPGGLVVTFSEQDVQEVFDLRILLEGHAVGHAAGRITQVELAELEQIQEQIEALPITDSDARSSANETFHWTVVTASRHGQLVRLLDGLRDYLPSGHLMAQAEDVARIAEQQHRDIIGALRAGDAERAQRVFEEHVELGRELIAPPPSAT